MIRQTLYSKRSNLVLGFHGCDKTTVDCVLAGDDLKESTNDYDWLGNGIYFWENNADRALEWAQDPHHHIKTPAVLGAILDLGYCMDLMDSEFLCELKEAYEILNETLSLVGKPMPKNEGKPPDKVLRKLDCAVVQMAHTINEKSDPGIPFDSVRGVFWEGGELYPGAGFSLKNHIQICVRNPNCIKGYFLPRNVNGKFIIP